MIKLSIISTFLLSILITPSFAQAVSNDCIDHIDQRLEQTDLILSFCNLQDEDMPALLPYLKAHPKVIRLWINHNHLTDAGAAILVPKIIL